MYILFFNNLFNFNGISINEEGFKEYNNYFYYFEKIKLSKKKLFFLIERKSPNLIGKETRSI